MIQYTLMLTDVRFSTTGYLIFACIYVYLFERADTRIYRAPESGARA